MQQVFLTVDGDELDGRVGGGGAAAMVANGRAIAAVGVGIVVECALDSALTLECALS